MHTFRRLFTSVAIASVVAVSATACAGNDNGTDGSAASKVTPPKGAQGSKASVTIEDFKFSPATLTVAADGVVSVRNIDSAAHTLTADDGSFDSGNLAKDQTAELKVGSQKGTRKYFCKIHDYMRGVITVG